MGIAFFRIMIIGCVWKNIDIFSDSDYVEPLNGVDSLKKFLEFREAQTFQVKFIKKFLFCILVDLKLKPYTI